MLDNMLDFQDKVRRYFQMNGILVNNLYEIFFFFKSMYAKSCLKSFKYEH